MDELKVLFPALGMIAYCLALGMILWILAAIIGHKLRLGKLLSTSMGKFRLLLDRLIQK
jgi:hypothetical protein